MIQQTTTSQRQHMTSLISDMLSGIYTIKKIVELFIEYPLEKLSSEQLSGCLDGVITNAAFHIDSSAYDKSLVIPAGTGGDMQSTVNITTMAGFVMAASESC